MLLRWEIQRGVSTAFKAVDPEHIQSNLEALDFELPQDDMRALTTIAYTVRPTTHILGTITANLKTMSHPYGHLTAAPVGLQPAQLSAVAVVS